MSLWKYIPRVVSNREWIIREFNDCISIQRVIQELTTRSKQYNLVFSGQVVIRCPTDSFDEFNTLGKTADGKHDKYKLLIAKHHFVYDRLAYISYNHIDELQEIANYFTMDEKIIKKIVVYNMGSFMQ